MASGTRGYCSYSGRGNRKKVALAVILILIILGAVAFLLLQGRIYYDVAGKPHIQLPERPAQVKPLSPEDVNVTIESGGDVDFDEEMAIFTRYTKAFSITETTLVKGTGAIKAVWAAEKSNYTAAAITLKDDDGKVWFHSAAAIPGSVKASAEVDTAVRELGQSDLYTIARINTLHDSLTAKQWVTDMGLRNRDGYIFYDGNNSQWLDASKVRTRQKICEMAAEAAEMGFNEVLLTGFAYPTEGNLENMKDGGVNHVETLESLLKEVRKALPEGVGISLELPAATIQNGGNEAAGHRLSSLASLVDAIYAETTETEISALRNSVASISKTCGFVAEVTDTKNVSTPYLLLK